MSKVKLNNRIGQRIKALRKEKGISQETLAEMIGKSVETVSNIERSIFMPRVDTAEDISKALGVELYELFIFDVSVNDKEKIKLINDIISMLKNQPLDLIKATKDQVKNFINLKDSFINRLSE